MPYVNGVNFRKQNLSLQFSKNLDQQLSNSEFWILDGRGKFEWINDGLCDDMNNNEACKYDGGDCCGVNVNRHFCIECKCISKGTFNNYVDNYFCLSWLSICQIFPFIDI